MCTCVVGLVEVNILCMYAVCLCVCMFLREWMVGVSVFRCEVCACMCVVCVWVCKLCMCLRVACARVRVCKCIWLR
jgi:hypothetical protein